MKKAIFIVALILATVVASAEPASAQRFRGRCGLFGGRWRSCVQYREPSSCGGYCSGDGCYSAPTCSTGTCSTGTCSTGTCSTGNCSTGNCSTGNCSTGNCSAGNCSAGNCVVRMDSDVASMLEAANAVRANYGLSSLAFDVRLQAESQAQADAQARYGGCFHTAGGGWENCAGGRRNVAETLNDWLNSPGHRANLLGNFRRAGIACAKSRNGRLCWTMRFGN